MLMAPAAGDDVAVTSHSGNHADPLLRPRLEATFIAPGDPQPPRHDVNAL
jgi:hypothetical protein